jgi:acyl carrier protein
MNNDIEAKIIKILKEYLGATYDFDEAVLNKPILSFGINSISFVTIVILIEQAFEFEFDVNNLDINNFSNIRCLISYVESEIP